MDGMLMAGDVEVPAGIGGVAVVGVGGDTIGGGATVDSTDAVDRIGGGVMLPGSGTCGRGGGMAAGAPGTAVGCCDDSWLEKFFRRTLTSPIQRSPHGQPNNPSNWPRT